MKKTVALLFALSIVFVLCACGGQSTSTELEDNRSDEVKNVERLIAAIGEVSLEREKYITDAEQAYAALLEADKELVENAAELKAARDTFTELLRLEADQVNQAISAIGHVNVDKEDQIAEAEASYAALPERAKAMVENYKELTDARYSLDILKQLFAAQERGETTIIIDGVKVSYVVDEDRWAVVENELTEEYEPADLAYNKQTLTWTDLKHRVVTEVPAGWNREQRTNGYMVGFLYTNKDATMAMYLWSASLTEKQLQYEDSYSILDAVAAEAIGTSREHGEFHHSIYGQHRAVWCRVDMDGNDTVFVFMLVDDDIIVLQAWRPNEALTKQLLGIAVHCVNHMIITDIE